MKLPFIMYTLSGWWSFLFGNIIMLLMMRFRYPMKKTVPLALFLIPLSVFDLWIYYLFGSETGGQLFLVINTIPSLLLFFYLSDYRDGRFLFTFFFSKLNIDKLIFLVLLIFIFFILLFS